MKLFFFNLGKIRLACYLGWLKKAFQIAPLLPPFYASRQMPYSRLITRWPTQLGTAPTPRGPLQGPPPASISGAQLPGRIQLEMEEDV